MPRKTFNNNHLKTRWREKGIAAEGTARTNTVETADAAPGELKVTVRVK